MRRSALKRYAERRAAKRCVRCGTKTKEPPHCSCQKRHAAAQRRRREALPIPEGACRGWSPPGQCLGVADEQYATCAPCRAWRREYGRAWKARDRRRRRLREHTREAELLAALETAERKLRDPRARTFAGIDRRLV